MKDIIEIKKLLLAKCTLFVEEKEATITELLNSAKNDLFSETKSSAGDKHETGRAMLQLEMEKASQQLAVVFEMKEILKKIGIDHSSKNCKLGSLIKTSKGTYFLAISVGQVILENETYFVVSTNSPIGNQLLGKEVGAFLPFNGAEILEVN